MTKPLVLTCSRCLAERAMEEFPIRVARGRPSYCKPCQREYGRVWRETNRERIRADARRQRLDRIERSGGLELRREWNNSLKSVFGITADQYEEMFERQRGLCGICVKPSLLKRLAVDHDRRCCPGKKSCGRCVRGLLCANCNLKLGSFEKYADEFVSWRDRRSVNV